MASYDARLTPFHPCFPPRLFPNILQIEDQGFPLCSSLWVKLYDQFCQACFLVFKEEVKTARVSYFLMKTVFQDCYLPEKSYFGIQKLTVTYLLLHIFPFGNLLPRQAGKHTS